MKRTIRSVIILSMLAVIFGYPAKVAAQQCLTKEQVAKAKESREKLKLAATTALQRVDSINKVFTTMQLDSVTPGTQIMQNQGGNITITNTFTIPNGTAGVSSGITRKEKASDSTSTTSTTTIQESSPRTANPITLAIGLIAGSGIGGDARMGYGNAFLDYRGFYNNQPNLYHRGSLGFISGNTDSKTRFLIGLSGSIKLVEENVTASSNVETGNINLGDSVIVTTDVKGSFWTPQHYHMGLFTGMQATLGRHLWLEGIVNPMFPISETGNFAFNCDLRCGYKLERNIFFGGFTYFNQTPALTVGTSLTF